jgi:hypothetical protein
MQQNKGGKLDQAIAQSVQPDGCKRHVPQKETRNENQSLWMQFLSTLTGAHNTSLQPLGDYISLPHTKFH